MIEVNELTKAFDLKTAVNNVSFAVDKGEILGFLGPNGAGKSTTMRMITGFLPPTSGTAVIGDTAHTEGNMIGIAGESGTAGQSVPVIIGGVSDVHSGLATGEVYYSDISGNLTITVTDDKIGLAISESEILLSIEVP